MSGTYGYLERLKDGTYQKTCGGKDDAVLAELTSDKAKAVIDKSSFVTTGMIRWSVLLARDDGIYYVDQLADTYGGKGYRVFVGKKGGMKRAPAHRHGGRHRRLRVLDEDRRPPPGQEHQR